MSKEPPRPLDQLYEIVDDLWGVSKAQTPENRPVFRPASSEAEQTKSEPVFPPFESLWHVADDTVDWTDALAHAAPVDSFTGPVLWSYFHEHAEKVLEGDVSAYVDVLKAANPLGDLTPYARGFNVVAESADRLSVSFEGLPCHLSAEDGEKKRYLAGMSLRCARDLMALLPVCETAVRATDGDRTLFEVVFERSELQKVRFSFVDPVQFALECGGKFCE